MKNHAIILVNAQEINAETNSLRTHLMLCRENKTVSISCEAEAYTGSVMAACMESELHAIESVLETIPEKNITIACSFPGVAEALSNRKNLLDAHNIMVHDLLSPERMVIDYCVPDLLVH